MVRNFRATLYIIKPNKTTNIQWFRNPFILEVTLKRDFEKIKRIKLNKEAPFFLLLKTRTHARRHEDSPYLQTYPPTHGHAIT